MNWYKEIKLCQVATEYSAYTNIGHGNETNILWVFWNGEIKTVTEETDMIKSHSLDFPEIPESAWESVYYGRYETSTEKCSIKEPLVGPNAHKDIPSILIRRLDSIFNNPIYSIF